MQHHRRRQHRQASTSSSDNPQGVSPTPTLCYYIRLELGDILDLENIAYYRYRFSTIRIVDDRRTIDQIDFYRFSSTQLSIFNHKIDITRVTPIEAMTGRTPSVLHIGVFGCDVYVHQDKTQRDTTFSPKAAPGIYLGHDHNQSCAIVMLLPSGKVVRTRDVEFGRTASLTRVLTRRVWRDIS